MTTDEVRIVPTREQYAESFNAVVDAVARERRYIGFVEGPSLQSTREFVRSILGGAGVQLLAVDPDDVVVGWCDIVRNPREGFRHVGRLGMGLLPGYADVSQPTSGRSKGNVATLPTTSRLSIVCDAT